MAGKDKHFLLMGLTLNEEIRHTKICLGRSTGEIYITISRRQQTKDIWKKMQHEYLYVYDYA
jgi:hypothetical protein